MRAAAAPCSRSRDSSRGRRRCTICSPTAPSPSPCLRNGLLNGMVVAAGAHGVQAVLELTDYAPLPVARARPLAGVDPRPAAPRARVRRIGPARPHRHREPQSRTAAGEHGRGQAVRGDTPYALMRLEIESVVVADSTGAESVCVSTLLDARPRPVLRARVLLAPTPRVGPPRSGRPTREQAPEPTAARARPSARPGSLRRPAARRERGRRPRRAAAVPTARRRRDRAEPGNSRADGLPVPQRPARAPHLSPDTESSAAATVAAVTAAPDEATPRHALAHRGPRRPRGDVRAQRVHRAAQPRPRPSSSGWPARRWRSTASSPPSTSSTSG